jgi:ATP synthase subunit 6
MKLLLVFLSLAAVLLLGGPARADEHESQKTADSIATTPATGGASAHETHEAHEAKGYREREEEHENDIRNHDTISMQKVIGHVLEHIADDYELHFLGAKVPLPIMFLDNFGFHFFPSIDALESSKEYIFKSTEEVETEQKLSQFVRVWRFKRVDGQPMGSSFFGDFSFTANLFFMAFASLLIVIIASIAGSRAKKSLVPKGTQNLVESLVVYVRDEIITPNVHGKWADKTTPYFLTVFFFILVMNLIGLVPLTKTATSAIPVTLALALCTFVVTQIAGIMAMGLGEYLKHFSGGILEMDLPVFMKIMLTAIMLPIEFIGLFTKPFALMIRLFANMTAGHIVIGSFIGLAIFFQSYAVGFGVSVPFALFIFILELLVAFIQAYVFTTLSAVFIGMMAHEPHHEEEHGSEPAAAH